MWFKQLGPATHTANVIFHVCVIVMAKGIHLTHITADSEYVSGLALSNKTNCLHQYQLAPQ